MWKRLGELLGKLFEPDPYWQNQSAMLGKSVVYNNQHPQNTTNQVNKPMATVGGNNNSQYGYQNKPATPASPKNNAIDPTPQVSIVNVENHVPKYNFYMTHEAQAKFNEYARAALAVYPGQSSEIGGLARVKQFGNDWVCIDIKIFEQQANAGYFELDEMAVPRFMQELLREGRQDELPEWCSLIHSHPPGCEPFLSATDRENIIRLGMGRFAWSIIATANSDVRRMSGSAYAVHYFQDGDVQVLIEKMPVGLVHPDRPAIEAEVKELIKPVVRTNQWKGQNPPINSMGSQKSFNTAPPKTVKKEEPKFNFDVNAVGIFPKDTVKVTLLEDSLEGAEPEAIEVLKQMDGKEFVVDELDKNGFVINNLILLPSEVSLVKSGAEPAKDAPATGQAEIEEARADEKPATVKEIIADKKASKAAKAKAPEATAETVSEDATEKSSDGTTEPVAQATGSEGDPED